MLVNATHSAWQTKFNKKQLTELMIAFKQIAGAEQKILEERFYASFAQAMKVEPFDARRLFKVTDATGDGTIDYHEFCVLVSILAGVKGEMAKFELAFRIWDLDDDGYISVDEMQASAARDSVPYYWSRLCTLEEK